MAGSAPKGEEHEQKPRLFDSLLEMAAKAIAPVLGAVAGEIVAPGGGVVAAAVGFNVKSAIGRGVGGAVEFAAERFGPPIVKIWANWFKSKRPKEQHAAFEATGRIAPKDALEQAQELVERNAPPGTSEEDKAKATALLAAIPGCVRRTLVPDKLGRLSVSHGVSLTDEATLLKAIPISIPPYKEGGELPKTDYILEQLLGMGGFGAVYRAANPKQQFVDPVAIKFCTNPTMKDALNREKANLSRLVGAAKIARSRWSPRIAKPIGYDLDHETPYLIYELVEGGDLCRFLREKPNILTHTIALQIIMQICEGLAFAHELGLVHRDLKPANVLIDHAHGRIEVKLTDFGISGIGASHSSATSASTPGQSEITPSISRLRWAGTPGRMPKEQARGDDPDPRHDVYSLGIMWYQLLLGDVDREMHPGWETDLDEAHAPAGQIAIIKKCFSQPEKRPKNGGEILKLVQQIASGANYAESETPPPPITLKLPEVSIAPIKVSIQPARAAQPQVSRLPPIATAILEEEGKLQGLRTALDKMEKGTHPALQAGQLELRTAEQRLKSLEVELESKCPEVGVDIREHLKRKISLTQTSSNAELCVLAPGLSPAAVLPLIDGLREAARGRTAIKKGLEVFQKSREAEQQRLRQEIRDAESRLYALQERDFELVLATELTSGIKGKEFPITKWLALEEHLISRRYGFVKSTHDLLAKAEAYFHGPLQDDIAWSQAKNEDCPASYQKYLNRYGNEGRHRAEARKALEKRFWEKAKEIGSWEAISEYLSDYPEGPSEKADKEDLGQILRSLVLSEPDNFKIRQCYLKFRTISLEHKDIAFYSWKFINCFRNLAGLFAVLVTLWILLTRNIETVPDLPIWKLIVLLIISFGCFIIGITNGLSFVSKTLYVEHDNFKGLLYGTQSQRISLGMSIVGAATAIALCGVLIVKYTFPERCPISIFTAVSLASIFTSYCVITVISCSSMIDWEHIGAIHGPALTEDGKINKKLNKLYMSKNAW